MEELAAATYHGLEALDPVTLTDGRWEGAPLVEGSAARPGIHLAPDFRVTGDLDGDGTDEVVVVLWETSGGTGTWVYLAMMGRVDGRVANLATQRLGDRVQIRDARIENAVLYVDVLQAGVHDAACCPGELASHGWELLDGRFNALIVSDSTQRFGPDALGGVEWVLERWDRGEPAPAEPAVTLRVTDGRASGNAGCNQYSGPVAQSDVPGDMRFGPFAVTRMMCPGDAMQVEMRYLEALRQAVTVGWLTGRLAVSYLDADGGMHTMLFTRRPRSAAGR
jgi:heat shock protein HslJ